MDELTLNLGSLDELTLRIVGAEMHVVVDEFGSMERAFSLSKDDARHLANFLLDWATQR